MKPPLTRTHKKHRLKPRLCLPCCVYYILYTIYYILYTIYDILYSVLVFSRWSRTTSCCLKCLKHAQNQLLPIGSPLKCFQYCWIAMNIIELHWILLKSWTIVGNPGHSSSKSGPDELWRAHLCQAISIEMLWILLNCYDYDWIALDIVGYCYEYKNNGNRLQRSRINRISLEMLWILSNCYEYDWIALDIVELLWIFKSLLKCLAGRSISSVLNC